VNGEDKDLGLREGSNYLSLHSERAGCEIAIFQGAHGITPAVTVEDGFDSSCTMRLAIGTQKQRTNRKAVNKKIQHFTHKVVARRKWHDQGVEERGAVL